jgi:ABC-2 type transport system ATP-binding protein
VLEQAVRDHASLRHQVGYLPGELNLYDSLSANELLSYFARLRGGVEDAYRKRLIERLDLDPTRPMRTLSKGNKQKVGLVQAFMHRPQLLILDEPTSGLDPLLQQEFQQLVRETQAAGATIFLSSHSMNEVQTLCNRVGIIREGRLVAVETVAALHQRALRRIRIEFAEPIPAEGWEHLGLKDLQLGPSQLQATVQGSLEPLIRALAPYRVQDFVSQEPSLEEIFLAYYTGRA